MINDNPFDKYYQKKFTLFSQSFHVQPKIYKVQVSVDTSQSYKIKDEYSNPDKNIKLVPIEVS